MSHLNFSFSICITNFSALDEKSQIQEIRICQKIRQIEWTFALLSHNVNKLSRIFRRF